MRGLVVTAVVAWARVAGAVPCGHPDLIDTVPVAGAVGVPTDALLEAHYASSAEYLGEPVVLVIGADERVLTARFDATQGLLGATSPEPFTPGMTYTVRWPALRGLNQAARGLGRTVTFTVGEGPDGAAPVFDGPRALDWGYQRRHNDCTDDQEERYLFDLSLAAPSDDGGVGGLALTVFQTAGPAIGAGGPRPVKSEAWPGSGRTRIELPADEAVGRVCFTALVRDRAGNVSAGGSRELCVTTVAAPFFEGCGVGGGSAGHGWWPVLGACLVGVLRARRRR